MKCQKCFNNINNNNENNALIQNENKISSPFLVKGTLKNKIEYEPIYSLKNFVPIYEQEGNLKIIGNGSYGQVFLGLNTINNKYYAIKHMDKNNIYNLLNSLTGIQKEIEIQSKIDHPNIVKLLYVKETDISYDLIMEYAQEGNLFHYIRKNKGLNENKTFSIFIQILNAVNFLNENDLIHRDIKPENILLFDNNIVKLCDFGWCVKFNGQQRQTFCGTTEYMSPELVKNQGYGKEIDVWSLGILLYEMIHGYSPFRPNKPNFDEKDVMENILNHNLNFEKEVSDECKQLIYGLLDPDISKRYKVEDIYNSKFIKKYENIYINLKNINSNDRNISKRKVNNIFNSPKIEMNNNINIHMSMDLKNYVYNIKFPENKNNYNISENNNIKPRNQSFPKIRGYIYPNCINSVNNNENIYTSNIYNNLNILINSDEDINKLNKINNILVNDNDDNNNINIINQKILIKNKTLNSYFPLNIEKNREEELINIYSRYNNIISENTKRDNINFINFNNNSFFNFGKNNSLFVNKINLINNSKDVQTISYSNSHINNLSSRHNIQIADINGIKENKNNNTILSNKFFQDIINNTANSISTIQKNDNNTIYKYYNNNNDYNFSSLYSNINYNSHYPEQSSLIKKSELNLNDNNLKLNKNNSFNKINNNIKKLSKVLIPHNKNISRNKKQKNIKNHNKNSISSKSGVFQNFKKIIKITESDKDKDSKLSIKIENGYNNKPKIKINNDSNNLNNNNDYLSKSNYFSLNKHQKINERLIIEKEPTDNIQRKNKTQKGKENIKIKKINKSSDNKNKNSKNDINYRFFKKIEKLINLREIQNEEPKKILEKKNINKSNVINNIKNLNLIQYKNICFDQPTEIMTTKINESNNISKLIVSKSCYDLNKSNKLSNNKKKNNISNTERNKNINNNYDKIKNQKKVIKYLSKKEKESKNKENNIDNNSKTYKLIDLKNNETNNKQNIINLSNNKKSAEQISVPIPNEKKPKNNKINYINKTNPNLINHNNKIKILQKNNKNEIKNNFIELTPNVKPLNNNYNITNNGYYSTSNSNKKIINNSQMNIENNSIGCSMNNYLKINNSNEEKFNPITSRINLVNENNNINYLEKEISNIFRKEKQRFLMPSNSFSNTYEFGKMKNNSINANIKMNMNINRIKNGKIIKLKDSNICKISKINNLSKKVGFIQINEDKSNIINKISDNNDKNYELNLTPKKKSTFKKVKPKKLLEAFRKELEDCSNKETIPKLIINNI